MKVCLLTNCVSPHQLPFAQEMVRHVGENNFRYIATEMIDDERRQLGWSDLRPDWLIEDDGKDVNKRQISEFIKDADVLLCGTKNFENFEMRVANKKLTFYMSERWFKPSVGMFRLLHPAYLRGAIRGRKLMRSPYFQYCPIGNYAAEDMRRVMKINIFKQHDLLKKMFLWGYFVEPSRIAKEDFFYEGPLKILWAGRMIRCKRVDTIIQAVEVLLREGCHVSLNLVGHGPEEANLRKMSKFCVEHNAITFTHALPIKEVRTRMSESQVYVLSSNGYEGWGAVVNEAMEEGCAVVASQESGSGATLIENGVSGMLFSSGNVKELAASLRLLYVNPDLRKRIALKGKEKMTTLWRPAIAANRFLHISDIMLANRSIPRYLEGPMMTIV